MSHVVLIGDSIFDNGVYVTPEPDVSRQLRARLGSGWTVTLLATDGHVTNDVAARQLARVPGDASHLVVSVGGNDALGHSSLLSAGASSVADALGRLAAAQASFARDYSRMIEATLQLGIPAAVCTIYDANHPPPLHGLIVSALALFNDVITRAAFAHGVPLIDCG
jgi:lysophospholipase L1-like esterase